MIVYVEIHGQAQPGLENIIDVATVGIDATKAAVIKNIINTELHKYYPAINCRVEPIDVIDLSGLANKKFGILNIIRSTSSAIHMEFTAQMRSSEYSPATADFLGDALTKISFEF